MTNRQLLEIVSCSLKNSIYKKPIANEKEVFKQAYENGLGALLFGGLDKTLVSKTFYEQAEKMFFSYVHIDNAQQALIKKIKQIFNNNKVKHIFLKGAHLKKLYPETYFRGMGDIDVLVLKEDLSKSRKLFKEAGFKTYSRSAEHDVYQFDRYYVEVHQNIYREFDKRKKDILKKPWDNAVFVKDYEYRLDYTFEGLYLLYHLEKHVMHSGIGLRSVLDIPIFFNYYQAEIDDEILKFQLQETKLAQFFQTILYLNKCAFKVESPYLDKNFQLQEEDYYEILNYLTISGIHGTGSDFNVMAPRLVKKSKIATFSRMVFPKWANMKEVYPWLKYLPFLLPIAYLLRGLRFLFLKTKYSISKIIKIKKADQEIEQLDSVFKKMGL